MRIETAVCTTLLLSCLGCSADDPDPDGGEAADTVESTPDTSGGESTTDSDPASESGERESDSEVSGGASSESSGGDAVLRECDPALSPTLFVNFDGVTLSGGPDDAPNDTTQLPQLAETLAPYDGRLDLDAVIEVVAGHVAPFDLCVTRVRPQEGPYAMVVVTANSPFGEDVLGVAPLDCDDANASNVGFVFSNEYWAVSPRALANLISSEFATTIGLESQSTINADVMCRQACDTNADRTYRDECIALAYSPPMCDQHEAHCPRGQQNSYQEMLDRFGPAR